MRIVANFEREKQLWGRNLHFVAGIDEVGRGSWAGPVVAAAVVFPPFFDSNFELFDSKLLLPRQREEIAEKIRKVANIGIGIVGVPTIDKIGIGKATQKAFRFAAHALKCNCDFYLIDAFYISHWPRENQLALKKGDQICASIAAASIVAKVYRDDLMRKLAGRYPQYGFDIHKGYGTSLHREKIEKHSLSRVHRKSFKLKFLLV